MAYVHGYSDRETQRLLEQSLILEELLHGGSHFEKGSRVLEVGCGVGAQSLILLRRNPGIQLTCLDINPDSLELARRNLRAAGYTDVEFLEGDVTDPSSLPGSFDHVFVCFVLEHLPDPVQALRNLGQMLKPGGSLTLIEGDHGSAIWTPETKLSRKAWEGLVISQRTQGHDPDIGRRLYGLMMEAGLWDIRVEPRTAYADASMPDRLHGAVMQIIHPMVYSAEKHVLSENWMPEKEWKTGLDDLASVTGSPGGSFFYSWFKGEARIPVG